MYNDEYDYEAFQRRVQDKFDALQGDFPHRLPDIDALRKCITHCHDHLAFGVYHGNKGLIDAMCDILRELHFSPSQSEAIAQALVEEDLALITQAFMESEKAKREVPDGTIQAESYRTRAFDPRTVFEKVTFEERPRHVDPIELKRARLSLCHALCENAGQEKLRITQEALRQCYQHEQCSEEDVQKYTIQDRRAIENALSARMLSTLERVVEHQDAPSIRQCYLH